MKGTTAVVPKRMIADYVNSSLKDHPRTKPPENTVNIKVVPPPRVLPGISSRVCHQCKNKRHLTRVRDRRSSLGDCDPRLKTKLSRYHTDSKPLRVVLIVIGFLPSQGSPWFECLTWAYCPKCRDLVQIHELSYKRQFGYLRRGLFRVEKALSWILPKH